MLEQRIEELTLAVKALTEAIRVQAPGRVVSPEDTAEAIFARSQEQEEAPNAEQKSSPTSNTSEGSANESQPVTYDDVKCATNAVSKISREKAIAGLARFGVTSATKLTEAQWPEYVAYMARVAAGEVDPEASHE